MSRPLKKVAAAIRDAVELEPHHPAFLAGYRDAQRGHTSNPYGINQPEFELWDQGYDFAFDNGKADLPRFGKLKHKPRR